MSRLRRFGLGLLGLLLGYAGLCAVLAYKFVHPRRLLAACPGDLREAKVGDTPVWLTPNLAASKPSRTAVVLAHGFRGNRGSWADLMRRLAERGIDAVAFAMPGQEASPHPSVGFGPPEARTMLDCAAWARARGAERVVGMGLSLGGAATWLASAQDPKAFDGVVTDSAFARFDRTMLQYLGRRVPGGAVLFRPVVWIAQGMTGIDPGSIRPLDAAAKWRGRPALVIQGGADTLVTPENGDRLAAAAGCPEWRVAGVEHGLAYAHDPAAYAERVVAFVRGL